MTNSTGPVRASWWLLLLIIASLLNIPHAWAADTTAPTTPTVTDDGAYTTVNSSLHAVWASSDSESGIAEYQYTIKRDSTSGTVMLGWTSAGTATSATRPITLSQGKVYYVGVKAKNGAGLWSAVGYSNGIKVDTTAPSPVTVTDDGATTTSTTSLHATWTASADAESGIAEYQYRIRQDSASGTILLDWTSAGAATSMTRTGLALMTGKSYVIGVRALNGAGMASAPAYSDGILVQPSSGSPPTGTITINNGNAATKQTAVTLTLSATDDSGAVAAMAISNDSSAFPPEEPYATTKAWNLTAGDGAKTVYVKFRDSGNLWSTVASDAITLDTKPPVITITAPTDGAVYGAP